MEKWKSKGKWKQENANNGTNPLYPTVWNKYVRNFGQAIMPTIHTQTFGLHTVQ